MKKKSFIYLLFSIFIILLVFLPQLGEGVIGGVDDQYHLYRIDSLAKALANGVFPVKVHAAMAYGYGYGTGLFYPDFFLYIPAVLMNMGLSLASAVKVFYLMLLTAEYALTGWTVWEITDDREMACASAALYVLSCQNLHCIYGLFAIGCTSAYVFVPAAIGGVYLYMCRGKGKWILFLGMMGTLLSHTLTFVVVVLIAVLVYLASGILLLRDGKTAELARRTCGLAGLGCLCAFASAFYVFPMLEQLREQNLVVKYPWTTSEEHVLTLTKLFFTNEGLGLGISAALVVSLIAYLLIYRRNRDDVPEFAGILLVIALAFSFVTVIKPFWTITRSITAGFQFPNRLCTPAAAMIAMIFGIVGASKHISRKAMRAVTFCLLVLFVFVMFKDYVGTSARIEPEALMVYDSYPSKGFVEGVSAGEWLPNDLDPSLMIDTNTAKANDDTYVYGQKEKASSVYRFTASGDKAFYDVPYIYYKGYRAVTAAGIPLPVEKTDHGGLVRVFTSDIGPNVSEEILVMYGMTKIQKISAYMSVIGMIACAAMLLSDLRKHKKKTCR